MTVVFFVISSNLQAQKIWFVVVAQQNSNIGESVKKDVMNMKRFMESAAKNCNMTLVYKYFDRSDYNRAGDYLVNLSPDSDDVIFYYYSGRGKNNTNDLNDKFPIYENMTLSGIHKMLKRKKARLTISMYDCKTIIVNKHFPEYRCLASPAIHMLMFKKYKGDIKISATSKGKPASGSNDIGGLFTKSFIHATHVVSGKTGVWNQVLNTAKKETNRKCDIAGTIRQNPYFEINATTIEEYENNRKKSRW